MDSFEQQIYFEQPTKVKLSMKDSISITYYNPVSIFVIKKITLERTLEILPYAMSHTWLSPNTFFHRKMRCQRRPELSPNSNRCVETTGTFWWLSSINKFTFHKSKPEKTRSTFDHFGVKFRKQSCLMNYPQVPVHAATSVIWFGSFYILCKSGIDVTALLSRWAEFLSTTFRLETLRIN